MIHLPAGCHIRPTSDRIKESLFNILRSVPIAHFLDLYAGCGNVGLEALSRGAAGAVFVEKEPRLANAIRENLRLLEYEKQGEVITAPVDQGLKRLTKRGVSFDIVFADPPYDAYALPKLLRCLETAELLAENGVIVVQHSMREDIQSISMQHLMMSDQRRYGETTLSFLRKMIEEEGL
jgi:16S rRNA (guanine(966)-N(2))-methyltransferase RsmD